MFIVAIQKPGGDIESLMPYEDPDAAQKDFDAARVEMPDHKVSLFFSAGLGGRTYEIGGIDLAPAVTLVGVVVGDATLAVQ